MGHQFYEHSHVRKSETFPISAMIFAGDAFFELRAIDIIPINGIFAIAYKCSSFTLHIYLGIALINSFNLTIIMIMD